MRLFSPPEVLINVLLSSIILHVNNDIIISKCIFCHQKIIEEKEDLFVKLTLKGLFYCTFLFFLNNRKTFFISIHLGYNFHFELFIISRGEKDINHTQ